MQNPPGMSPHIHNLFESALDAVVGMGGMFSLDNGTGRRFLTRSEVCL